MTVNRDGSVRVGRGEARTRVLRALADRADEIVDLDELVRVTGLSAQQVSNAVYTARMSSEAVRDSLDVVVRGQLWRWRSSPIGTTTPVARSRVPVDDLADRDADDDDVDLVDGPGVGVSDVVRAATDFATRGQRARSQVFERVGNDTPDGEVILRDEHDVLWRARRLT